MDQEITFPFQYAIYLGPFLISLWGPFSWAIIYQIYIRGLFLARSYIIYFTVNHWVETAAGRY